MMDRHRTFGNFATTLKLTSVDIYIPISKSKNTVWPVTAQGLNARITTDEYAIRWRSNISEVKFQIKKQSWMIIEKFVCIF